MRKFSSKLLALAGFLGLTLFFTVLARRTSAMRDSTAPDPAAIDAYIQSEMDRARIPGLALAIVRGDKVLHARGFGVADPQGRPVTERTPFIIGSNSKSFTALAIMQLVEADHIDLDAPVQRYLPWFRVAGSDAVSGEDASARITVRHLLYHTGGIPTSAGQAFAGDDDNSARALERHVRALRTIELSQPVGQTYQYSNANYNVLGLLVQVVSGQSYEDYVRDHIFEPLQMHDSFASEEEALQHGLATGYQRWFGFPRPTRAAYNRGDLPSGFLISSAQDMAHYLIAQLNEGRYQSSALLSAQGMATLHRPGVETPSGAGYAMGWSVTEFDGIPVVLHSGATDNFRSHMVLLPQQSLGFAILMNVNDAVRHERLDALRSGVAHLLAGKQPPPVPSNWPGWLATFALPAFFILGVIGLLRALRTLNQWRLYPQQRPRRLPAFLKGAGLPWAWHLLCALALLVAVPRLLGLPLRLLTMIQPDLAWTLIGAGTLSILAALARTVTVLLALPGMIIPRPHNPATMETHGDRPQLPA